MVTTLLHTWIDLRDGETRLFGLMSAHAMLYGASKSLLLTAATAIFLTQFDDSVILWSYLVIAVASILLSVVLTHVQEKFPSKVLYRGILLLLIAAALSFWFGLLVAAPAWIVFALMAWERVQDTVFRVEWFGIQGELLNMQQSKRLLGPIGVMEMIGKVIINLIVPLLLQFITARALVFLAIIGYALIYIVLELLMRQAATDDEPTHQARQRLQPTRERTPTPLKENKFLWAFFASIALAVLLEMVLTYGTFGAIQSRYTTETSMATFLSWVQFITFSAVLLIRALLTEGLVRRFGAGAGFAILPVILAISSGISIASGVGLGVASSAFFFSVIVIYTAVMVVFEGIYDTSIVLLLQVLNPKEQLQAQIGSEMVITPLATGVTGIVLLLLRYFGWTSPLIAISICALIAVGMIGVTYAIYKLYHAALAQTFEAATFAGEAYQLSRAELKACQQRLRSQHAIEVQFAVDQLKATQHPFTAADLSRLLTHRDSNICTLGLQLTAQTRCQALLPMVYTLLSVEQTPQLQCVALDTLCTLAAEKALPTVRIYLTSDVAILRHRAMTLLLQHGDLQDLNMVTTMLTALLKTTCKNTQLLLAETLLNSHIPALYDKAFIQLLDNATRQVKRHCYKLIGDLGTTVHLDKLIAAIHVPHYAGIASTSLVKLGAVTISTLQQHYECTATTQRTKQRLLNVLGQLNLPAANAYLVAQLPTCDMDSRRLIYSALTRNQYHAQHIDLAELMALELETAASLTALQATLSQQPADTLLLDGLAQASRDVRHQISLLLGLMREPKVVQTAKRALDHGSATQQALGLEYFEIAFPKQFRTTGIALFDPQQSTQERWAKLQHSYAQYQLGIADSVQLILQSATLSPWLKTCAAQMATKLNDTQGQLAGHHRPLDVATTL